MEIVEIVNRQENIVMVMCALRVNTEIAFQNLSEGSGNSSNSKSFYFKNNFIHCQENEIENILLEFWLFYILDTHMTHVLSFS